MPRPPLARPFSRLPALLPAVLTAVAADAGAALSPAPAVAAAQDNNVEWEGVFSDTTGTYASPVVFNAGDAITLRLRARAGDLTAATVRLWFSGIEKELRVAMTRETAVPGSLYEHWRAPLTVPTGTTRVYYRFELTDGTDTDYFDAGAPGDAWLYRGMSESYRGEGSNFSLIPGFSVPDWAQAAVFYQVFPDRFADGDPANNRLFPDDCFWFLDYAPASPEAAECATYDVVDASSEGKHCEVYESWSGTPNGGPCDFFGGDLEGVTSRLDHVRDMGATALYLTPVFRSRSNHKYDALDHDVVDPRFGGQAALNGLSTAAHEQGMRLVLDGVFNHESDLGERFNRWQNYDFDAGVASGYDAFPSCGAWEQTFLNSQAPGWPDCSSPWRDWFKIWVSTDYADVDRDGDTGEAAAHTCGWYGLEFMPELDYKSPSNPDSAARTWLYGGSQAAQPSIAAASTAGKWLADGGALEQGADGWRIDVPFSVGYFNNANAGDCSKTANDTSVWRGLRTAARATASDAWVVGELWDDASSSGGHDWFADQALDAVMNYHYFGIPLSCFLTGTTVRDDRSDCQSSTFASLTKGSGVAVDALDSHLALQRRVYPAGAYFSSMNLISSHDTSRFITRAGGDHRLMAAAIFLQATLPGAPMLYYGEELALEGANAEAGRVPFPWTALEQDTLSDGARLVEDATRDLMCVRNAYPALRTGSFVTLWTHNADRTWAFGRFDDTARLVAVFNGDGATHQVRVSASRLDLADGTTLIDLVTGATYVVAEATVIVEPGPYGYAILTTVDQAEAGRDCFVPNEAPRADAGVDQSVDTCEVVTLDGSASSDPDGDSLTYVWTDGAGQVLGTTARIDVGPLPAGTHVFTLTVSDGEASSSDTVQVVVEAATGCGGGCPSATAGPTRPTFAGLTLLLPFALVAAAIRRARRSARRRGRGPEPAGAVPLRVL